MYEDNNSNMNEVDEDVDPIYDIIDYLVRCAHISFKKMHVGDAQVKTAEKIQLAYSLFTKSPTMFLQQFGKYLSPNHLPFFENLQNDEKFENTAFNECLKQLKDYHSERNRHKRVRNRRYKALEKMQQETDYFSEKQMMFRNPLLYEQLIGQYLNEDDILKRDADNNTNLTFLNVILNTVDLNEMNEIKNKQMLEEHMDTGEVAEHTKKLENNNKTKRKMWGEFDEPDTRPDPQFESSRPQSIISGQEKTLLREEFFQEMYSSFLEGRDQDVDYNSIDDNEDFDDLRQISQDAEDKYFDEEINDTNNLEEHMKLVDEYGKKKSTDLCEFSDPLDVFMEHIKNKKI